MPASAVFIKDHKLHDSISLLDLLFLSSKCQRLRRIGMKFGRILRIVLLLNAHGLTEYDVDPPLAANAAASAVCLLASAERL